MANYWVEVNIVTSLDAVGTVHGLTANNNDQPRPTARPPAPQVHQYKVA